jgi:hypothetical protein
MRPLVLRHDEQMTQGLHGRRLPAHDPSGKPILGPGVGEGGFRVADVTEVLCTGTLVMHVDESAWCTEPKCDTRWSGDPSDATRRHPVVTSCSAYFVQDCPACRDIRVWSR